MKTITVGSVMLVILAGMSLCSCQNQGNPVQNGSAIQADSRSDCAEGSVEAYEEGLRASETGDMDRAQHLLSKAVALEERNAYAWMELGMVEFRRDNLFAAATAFDRASKLEPERYESHFNVGSVLELVGRYEEAAAAYERALELSPEQVEVMENLARCYVRSNTHLSRAKELVDRALASERRPEWRQWLEEQSMKLGQHKETGL